MATTPGQRAIDLFRKYATKADVARQMLDEGYSVSVISKAVPMAYSQVHSIAAKMGKPPTSAASKANIAYHDPGRAAKVRSEPKLTIKEVQRRLNEPRRPLTRAEVHQPTRPAPRVGPAKIVAQCGNCGYPLEARTVGGQRQLIHVGVDADEYIKTVQFCHAIPAGM